MLICHSPLFLFVRNLVFPLTAINEHFNKKSKFISGFHPPLCGMMRYHQYNIALKDCPANGIWAYPHYLKQ